MSATPDNSRHPARTAVTSVPALELRDVLAGYDRVRVLRGVSMVVPASKVVALLGPNGAGKTTTLRVASGRLRASSGTVEVDGQDVSKTSPDRLARAGVCSIPEGRGVFPSLTVTENLQMWTYRGRLSRAEVEEAAFTRFPRLAERRKQLAGTLSGGEQQMLAMSRALSTNPKLLLLDEISMGLAPLIVSQLYELVSQIAAEGYAIVLVEQFAQTALDVADYAAVMTRGRIELQGSPNEVRRAVADIYLRNEKR
jgi:branched-chain amino acid transport system ATP-binding protein